MVKMYQSWNYWSSISSMILISIDDDYQQDSRVLYTFVPNKPFGSLFKNI